MNRVLLTGIGGSIGCHFFAHFMTHTDWEVVGIDSFRHKGWTDRVARMIESHPEWQKRLKLVIHDINAPISPIMAEKLGKIDFIINMASLSDVYDSIQNPVPFIKNNVDITLNMLEYARVAKPKAFIQISTDEVYGPTDGVTNLKEWSPILPSNPYAASKAAQEAMAIAYWRTYNVPVIITNTMNNWSEMQQSSKFPVMIQKALMKDEEVTIHAEPDGQIGSRSYIHSRNFADAILFILNNTKPYLHQPLKLDQPDRYNIAGERQLNNLELAQMIARLMDKELKYKIVDSVANRPGHDPHYGLDDSKLKKMGWRPPVEFEQSLKNVIDWQTANPEWLS